MKLGAKIRSGSWTITLPLAAGALAYLWFLFVPGMRSTADVRQQLQAKQDEVLQADNVKLVARETEKELRSTQAFVDIQRQGVPAENELAGLYGRINELAKLAGVTTARFEPREAVEFEMFKQVPVNLAITGSYNEVRKFLANLEELSQTVWIESVMLSPDGHDAALVACDVELVVFADRVENSDGADGSR